MAKPATCFAIFPVNKHPSNSEVICRCKSPHEECDLVPLVTFSVGDSELIILFQEAYARLFSNCYNKQGIQSNMSSYRPMNQGTICAKVYPESVQPIKRNNCGLVLVATLLHGLHLMRLREETQCTLSAEVLPITFLSLLTLYV